LSIFCAIFALLRGRINEESGVFGWIIAVLQFELRA